MAQGEKNEKIESDSVGSEHVAQASESVQGLAYASAKRWLMGIEAGLLASWFGAPVALLIANAEWAYQFFLNDKWPMPGWEKIAIVMGNIIMTLLIIFSATFITALGSLGQ